MGKHTQSYQRNPLLQLGRAGRALRAGATSSPPSPPSRARRRPTPSAACVSCRRRPGRGWPTSTWGLTSSGETLTDLPSWSDGFVWAPRCSQLKLGANIVLSLNSTPKIHSALSLDGQFFPLLSSLSQGDLNVKLTKIKFLLSALVTDKDQILSWISWLNSLRPHFFSSSTLNRIIGV